MTMFQALLDGYFNGGTVPANLYVGLVSSEDFLGSDVTTDTMASHPNWIEFEDVDEPTRPLWDASAVIGAYPSSINNPDGAVFVPNVAGSAVGVFLCDDDTIGGATGQLYGPFLFAGGPQELIVGAPFKAIVNFKLRFNSSLGT
jgi:hypothetical protein